MILTTREADNLNALLYEIGSKVRKKNLPKNTLENLCRKARLVLSKAGRKRQVATKLHFEIGDFD